MELVFINHEWSRESVQADPNRLYLFGDNLTKKGQAGQACIRGLPNAYGIPTKRLPRMTPESFFEDGVQADKQAIDEAIAQMPTHYEQVVVHVGLGRGLAQLDKKAPVLYRHMIDAIVTKVLGETG